MLLLTAVVACVLATGKGVGDLRTATIDDVGIEVDEGMNSAGEKQRALGARTLELLRNGQQEVLPVKDVKELVDCHDLFVASSCPQTADKDACQQTVVEYDGVRYVCFYTENVYGAQEIAEFAGKSACLKLLDLTGCCITSTGMLHIAEALQSSLTLESLILRHNEITSGPAGEEALASFCEAARKSPSLRHLDLRYTGLCGEAAAVQVGSILEGNGALSHLELSWNPLEASGGQALLHSIRSTSGLFDCQLTGCRLADETMQEIAELLLRNRKAHRASMSAGPYQGSWISNDAAVEGFEMADGLKRAMPPGSRSQGQAAAANYSLRCAVANIPGNAVVSELKTEELMERLFDLRQRFLLESSGNEKAARVHEFLQYLSKGQSELKQNLQAAEGTIHRTGLIAEGFQDRELRYRGNIAAARDQLLDYAQEYSKLQAALRRSMEDLAILRDDLEIAKDDFKRSRQNSEDDEDRDRGTLALLSGECKELERKLSELKDRGGHLDFESNMLRSRAEQVRERVANEVAA
ncbi:Lrrc45 [Symbiodinium pilosum]|uniref:Lrrc45 protein n=1 Tax=Symbiodinium pilosum TaxID=2952 RepID=A0A812XM83_SYMPI|nr:Lrrc45 [Symbiodinium pilosum]